MATGSFFKEVEIPEQRSYDDGILFPVVLSPSTNNNDLTTFKEAIKAEKPRLESLLQERGVVFFRGFPVNSAYEFNDVVEAFGFPEALFVGGRASRTKGLGRLYTANESPPENPIPFHHEMAYLLDFPSKLFFFCEEAPEKGGETPIVLSHIIYEKMKAKHPEFVAQLEEHGVKYMTMTTDEDRQSSFTGRGWRSSYMTDDKNVAKERAAKLGVHLEWNGNEVKTTTVPMPAIRFDKGSQRKTWLNDLAISYNGPASKKFHNEKTSVVLGNGDPVPDDAMEDCYRFFEEECVAIPWKKGDVMLVNNLLALHARNPLVKPPRHILASLCK